MVSPAELEALLAAATPIIEAARSGKLSFQELRDLRAPVETLTAALLDAAPKLLAAWKLAEAVALLERIDDDFSKELPDRVRTLAAAYREACKP